MSRPFATARRSTDAVAATVDERRLATDLAVRAIVEHVAPQIDGGRFPIKRTPGERVVVTAEAFADGHDVLAVVLRDRPGTAVQAERTADDEQPDAVSSASPVSRGGGWRETEMTPVAPGGDTWTAAFAAAGPGWHEYAVVAWVDRFRTWRHAFEIKARAEQDIDVELLEGSLLVRDAAGRSDEAGAAADAAWLLSRADTLADDTVPLDERIAAALDAELGARMFAYADRSRARVGPILRVRVDRDRARFGSWYELFPRSAGPSRDRSGTFAEAAALLPRIADLGFDVVYLPPIHPIGVSFRKGPNNALVASPGDPGSPWAIGSADGGHTDVEPGLGTLGDFVRFREAAERLGLEVALDLAWQCSPDHPWVSEHPEWFRHRPDGTVKYAENPPKKYQDIYPLDFESDDWRALWEALLAVTLFWVERGVRIFRVDNPHTKTFGFWEWLIAEVQRRHQDVVFLAEAFTRPPLMRYLAKAGFSQSYTYFTWRNTKDELTSYLRELFGTEVREYFRPNFFANTPDILHAYLQQGGRPAFEARLVLAATLSASYGIYSGFELCESRAAGPVSEEYADSEKYQFRKRQWDRAGHINELVARVNAIRRRCRALQFNDGLAFHATDNPAIIAYSKRVASLDGEAPAAAPSAAEATVLTIVNLDPHHMQHGWVDAGALAGAVDRVNPLIDLLDDARYGWHAGWNYVRFDPGVRQAHVLIADIDD